MSKSPKKILFLYTELAGYFLTCLKKLTQLFSVEVHVIHYPVNPEAPFIFHKMDKIVFYEREKLSKNQLHELVQNISPDIILCSGWIDKNYLSVCKKYFQKIPTVLTMDNQWKASAKQYLAILLSRFYFLKIFSHAWVTGMSQQLYAEKLGFKKNKIMAGFYSADVESFSQQYLINKELKTKKFPRRLLYIARYYEFKGIKDLWRAFIELQNEIPNEWELWCFGKGDISPLVHPKIKHFGFVQPGEMKKYIGQTGAFILPSHFEPWGVAVHEFAAAGFPLICSNEVGAASEFLKEGDNGFLFPAKNINELKIAMKKMFDKSDAELNLMGKCSAELAKKITPEIWTNTLWKIVNENQR